jgi:uncharacterized protein YceH (UPF0502 family)
MADLQLSAIEARVIAALAEKAVATPQYYPMTVNALMLAANQKNSRDPVMKLSEGEVGAALNRLQELGLCARDDSLGRVPKWRHQFQHHLLLAPPPFALLVTLILRGPQTAAELRANAAGLGGPADLDDAQNALKELADRAQPLVVLLPRAAGYKEARYAHTLSGPPAMPERIEEAKPMRVSSAPAVDVAALEERIRQLEERVAALEQLSPKP